MNPVGVAGEQDSPPKSFDTRHSMAVTEDGDVGDTCRICRGEGSTEQPLFYPCKCSGSIRYVHQECLMEWLSHSQKKYCELCKTSFRFTKLYDQSMPEVLPLPLFMRQVALYGARTVGRWLRYMVVILVWTCCLPWVIRQVWRGLFWLADGSFTSEQELRQMVFAGAFPGKHNATKNDTQLAFTTSTRTISVPQLSPTSLLTSLFTSDALLKGLLRLVSSKAFTISPLTTNLNDTGRPTLPPAQLFRQPSLLSDMQSLNSFTRHARVNNILIDILEGQLVCLCIIAAFILVFLIREWVINQQPIHMMPDPDQADVQPVAQPQNEDVPQVARRRRLHVRHMAGAEVQQDNQAFDVAQRPRAIPRQRRVVLAEPTDDTLTSEEQHLPTEFPVRSSSLAHTGTDSEVNFPSRNSGSEPQANVVQDTNRSSRDLHSPPLERGIFDDAVSIRRSIEEHSSLRRSETIAFMASEIPIEESNSHARPEQTTPSASTQPFDFAALASRNESREFTFMSATNLDQSSPAFTPPTSEHENEGSRSSVSIANHTYGTPNVFMSQDVLATTSNDTDEYAPSVSEDNVVVAHEEGTAVEPVPVVESIADVVENVDLLDRIANWLWYVEDGNSRSSAQDEAHPAIFESQNADALVRDQAPAVQVPHAAPVVAPIPAPQPAHEPNIQFGIDLNDPNAMDEAEDLEGILELIGMEGPMAGMIQNLIFSIFLITLTLSAGVWCPYIWGKIALLVMTHPIGVFVRAPLFILSRTADMLIDVLLLILGIIGLLFTNITKVFRFLAVMISPVIATYVKINPVEDLAVRITQTSSVRLEKALSTTILHLRPDLPTFSMQSHHALRVFKAAFFNIGTAISNDVLDTLSSGKNLWQAHGLVSIPLFVYKEVTAFPSTAITAVKHISNWAIQLSNDLRMPVLAKSSEVDLSLIEWSTKDKILAIVIGYVFFALSGSVYLKITRIVMGLKKDEKVEGIFADSLRQAGGVMKVIFIIGIEMIFFPLYCGLLLDVALLPLFKDATLTNRLQFVMDAPITGTFVHWFIGTCYMFHFALFVSMCRKIMRKGVLYFIRDPDDPTFHPVRDVLERPVLTQLSKIAFSACVYGGLVLACLGGVIWTISSCGPIFPIQWATNEPRLAFPADVIFFNFLLPFVLRTTEPSKKVAAIYDWWFRRCARLLRLSHFLFGEEREDEKEASAWFGTRSPANLQAEQSSTSDHTHESYVNESPLGGYWVRAPASDAVRIPKGTKVFLEVDKNNNRIDGQEEKLKGLHGKEDERFAKIFVPSKFRARIASFIFLVWLFASCTGAAITLGPLLIGRATLYTISGSKNAPNDLYAFTIGIHLTGTFYMLVSFLKKHRTFSASRWVELASDLRTTISRLLIKIQHVAGLLYLTTVFGLIIPIFLSLLAELYVHMPIYEYFVTSLKYNQTLAAATVDTADPTASPTIHLAQSWTIGVLFLRLILRAALRYPSTQSPLATAVRATIRDGILHPDVGLASRALVLPLVSTSVVLLVLPIVLAQGYILSFGVTGNDKLAVYRHAYPSLLLGFLALYSINRLRHKINSWQVKVRDEIYLVGERLHNFTDTDSGKEHSLDKMLDKGKTVDVGSSENQQSVILNADMDSRDSLRHRRGHINDGLT